MQRKKVLSLIVAAALTAGLICGCANTAAPSGKTDAEESAQAENAEESAGAGSTEESTDTDQEAEISLETIAELNGVEAGELNTVYDAAGNLCFIGNKISEDSIQDADAAYDFVTDKLAALLRLDDITLSAGESYTSPNTGVTYYRFNQTLPADIEAKMADGSVGTLNTDMEYLTSSVKLGVDSDGKPVVLVSDLTYDVPEFDADSMITPEDAEAVVSGVHPDAHIYSNATSLALWKDDTARSEAFRSGAAVVYLVYADNPDYTGDSDHSPYICYEVRADGQAVANADGIIANLAADTLSSYTNTSVDNTSLVYFDDMEDVGEYTYTVNFDWMNEADKAASEAYAGGDSLEITVPVMRCTTDGLYYLGWKEHNISMCNALDFFQAKGDWAGLNAYVTDDPEDLNSWHFERAENEKLACTYADDPNYVLSSFAEYVKVIDTFGTHFGMYDSYPSDSYMLLTYDYESLEQMYEDVDTYPAELAEFTYNAGNGGKNYDWNVFFTSPNGSGCLEDVVMCHEFTHGVNAHFTNNHYANEQGAVMEALADIVGYQMAAVYLNPSLAEAQDWLIGGTYGPVLRDLCDPLSMHYPEYKGGVFYVNPVDPTILMSAYADRGGAHRNSLIPCYLGTQLVKGTPQEGEKALTLEESLQMWFEVLYLSNYSTDFVSLGADLAFAAKALDLPEEEQAYVNRLIREYGFRDGTVDPQLLESEDSKLLTIHLDYEDAAVGAKYYFLDVFADLLADTNMICGGFTDNQEQTIHLLKDTDYPQLVIAAQSEQEVQTGSMYQVIMATDQIADDTTFHVKKVEVPAGETMTLEAGETVANMMTIEIPGKGESPIAHYQVEKDDAAGTTGISSESPSQDIIVTKEDGAAEGEYNLYLVDFE